MSYSHRPDTALQEPEATEDSPRSPFSEVAGRLANWITGADRMPGDETEPVHEPGLDPLAQLAADTPSEDPSRFPLAPFGYNRAAVDEHLYGLERELAELRTEREPPVSVNDELERIGEQTASILVVAHEQAHETTRLAQEQAERCVADAAANAVSITAEANERLRELDGETDSVWRERERLLEDVRVVSAALAMLADQASERFPAAEPTADSHSPVAFPRRSEPQATEAFPMPTEPQATEAFPMGAEPAAGDEAANEEIPAPGTQPGDTGSWLAGLEPPDQPQK